ncbi:MAG: hypothetical protein J6X43_02760, partial [Bacteroidales bacterium]|nr:hypothetical protein [Bacteroidales bacterium]
LATLSANFTSYTVDTAINNVISYYVGVKLPEVVNPKTQFLKAESGPFSLAISNIAEVENVDVAIGNTIMSNVEVYSIGHRVYVKNAEEKSITLFDNSGRALECRKAEQNAEEFNVRLAGVYFVKVDGESFAVIVR